MLIVYQFLITGKKLEFYSKLIENFSKCEIPFLQLLCTFHAIQQVFSGHPLIYFIRLLIDDVTIHILAS